MPDIAQDRVRAQKFTTAGGTTAYTATVPNLAALYDGFRITVKMNATNTGASTLNVNGIGAKTIKKPRVLDVAANDLLINSCYELVYDLAQDFFFLLRVDSTDTDSGGFGGGVANSFGLLDYIFAQTRTATAGSSFDNIQGVYETITDIYVASFVTFVEGNPDSVCGIGSIIKIDKTTFETTIYRSNSLGVAYTGATPDSYMTEDSGIIYFGYDTGAVDDQYIGFDTSTDTFSAYGPTVAINVDVVIIGGTVPPTVYEPGTAGIAPGSALPIALGEGGYEYSTQQRSNTDTGSDVTNGACITFLTRSINIYNDNGIGIEINNGGNTEIVNGGIFFKSDGTSFYIVDANSGDIKQYDLGVARDLSTYVFSNTYATASIGYGLFWGNSGTYMYHTRIATNLIYRITAGTPWDTSTLGASQSYNPTAQVAVIKGVWLKDDGTKMYVLDETTNSLYQYTLGTPRQISAGVSYDTVSFDFSNEDLLMQAIAFSTDGSLMFASGDNNQTVFQYTLSTPWDLSTASYLGAAVRNTATTPVKDLKGIAFRPDMSYAYMVTDYNTSIGSGNNLLEFIQA